MLDMYAHSGHFNTPLNTIDEILTINTAETLDIIFAGLQHPEGRRHSLRRTQFRNSVCQQAAS
jgi:hypothetical protein